MPEQLRVAYTLEQCWHDVPGGTASATLRVLDELATRPEVEMVGVAGKHRAPPTSPFVPTVPVRQLPIARPWLYEAWNRIGRPRVERATGPVDVCHSTVAIPAGTSAPHVVTVHDIAFVQTPERFSRHGVRVMRAGLERCRRADVVVCPSQATADDLSVLGFAEGLIRVIPWGADVRVVEPSDIERVRTTFALPERFVLFVGTLEPRKNLPRLAAAVERLGDMPLVVAGAKGWGDVDVATAPDVRWLGFVGAADLAPLYAAATVFAYPSLQEGFGLPILEAMGVGTPVVTSRGSSTEEVAGGAAVLIDATDVESIAEGIEAAVADRSLGERGIARAGAMSWGATASATIDVYREVAS